MSVEHFFLFLVRISVPRKNGRRARHDSARNLSDFDLLGAMTWRLAADRPCLAATSRWPTRRASWKTMHRQYASRLVLALAKGGDELELRFAQDVEADDGY